MALELFVSVCPLRCTQCEPNLTLGWRLDRGSQKRDYPVFTPFPWDCPAAHNDDTTLPSSDTSTLDLHASRVEPNIHKDEHADDDATEEEQDLAAVEHCKDTCRRLYRQWMAGPKSYYRITVPVDNPEVEIEDISISVALYGVWLAPSNKDLAHRLVERGIDRCTLSLGAMMDFARARDRLGRRVVCQLSHRLKLGVAVDLSRSTYHSHPNRPGPAVQGSLVALLRGVPEDRERIYRRNMKLAGEWSLRMSLLANIQAHAFHPTRRYYGAEQSLRKFNGSYFLSNVGDPHPGMRWIALQSQNLTVLDTTTVLEWLRVVLLTERVTYLPSECVTRSHMLLMARRLLALMAAVPARACAYMSDCIDRCPPCIDPTVTSPVPGDTPLCHTHGIGEPDLDTHGLAPKSDSGVSRGHASHSRSSKGSASHSHALSRGGHAPHPPHPPHASPKRHRSPRSHADKSAGHETKTHSNHAPKQAPKSSDHGKHNDTHDNRFRTNKFQRAAYVVGPGHQGVSRQVQSESSDHTRSPAHRQLVEELFRTNSAFVGARRGKTNRPSQKPLCSGSHTGSHRSGHGSSHRSGHDGAHLGPMSLAGAKGDHGDKDTPGTHMAFGTCKHRGYRCLVPGEANALFHGLRHTTEVRHITEQIDEYDGMLSCMRPGITCDDCESEAFSGIYRCAQALRRFFAGTSPSSEDILKLPTEVATPLEAAWLAEIRRVQLDEDWECVSVLCSIAMGAMGDGGKRSTEFDGDAGKGVSRDVLARNLRREEREERGRSIPPMKHLEDPLDGTAWGYWPRVSPGSLSEANPSQDDLNVATGQVTVTAEAMALAHGTGGDVVPVGTGSGGGNLRLYSGEHTEDTPDLGCHICTVTVPWPVLLALAMRGIEVEREVQTLGRPLTDNESERMRASWTSDPRQEPVFAREPSALRKDLLASGVKRSRTLDPAFLLLEATEYSQCQQSGDEPDGLGRSLDDEEESSFFRMFKHTFGADSTVFMQRLPAHVTRNYDMYHCALEFSSYRLFREFGCGNWTLYSMTSGRHGVDFRELFKHSSTALLSSWRGSDLCVRPTTPLMPPERFEMLEQRLWPVERLVPYPPQLESVRRGPYCEATPLGETPGVHPDPSTQDQGVRVHNSAADTTHTLFVDTAQWSVERDGVALEKRFEQWAKEQRVQVVQGFVRIHAYLKLVVLRCRPL